MSVLKNSQTFKYATVTIPAKGPAYSPVRFSRKVRRKSLKFRAEIRTFHLEQSLDERPRQTWRATAIHVSFRVRIHETTHRSAGFWLGRKTQQFSGTNQKPERRRPFGTGLVRHCPQGLFSPFFTFLRAIFFCPFRLSLAPTICPWVSEDVPLYILFTNFALLSLVTRAAF